MTWSPDLIDLTRPMTRETIVELAGKLVAEPSPDNEVEAHSYLRSWDTDNGSLCQWSFTTTSGPTWTRRSTSSRARPASTGSRSSAWSARLS